MKIGDAERADGVGFAGAGLGGEEIDIVAGAGEVEEFHIARLGLKAVDRGIDAEFLARLSAVFATVDAVEVEFPNPMTGGTLQARCRS